MSYDKNFPGGWHTTASWSTPTTTAALVSAPGVGKSLVITDFIIEANTAGTWNFHEGNTSTVMFNMRHWAANTQAHAFTCPLILTENTPLHITTNRTITVQFISGYILDR